ncbi:MAG: AEC family transporter [Pseudomonadota bacterium]
MFARLVTDFALPALIFASLSLEPFHLDRLLPAFVLFLSIAITMFFAWLIGRAMNLSKPVLGSVMLVAGVGSSSTLGYSIVRSLFDNDQHVMNLVVTMGEFGVILPLFTFGVMVAMYFGRQEDMEHSAVSALRLFVASPVFIATVLGIAFSYAPLDREQWLVDALYELFAIISGSLDVLVAFAVGMMLRPIPLRQLAPLILLVAGLKLVGEPVLVWLLADSFHLEVLESDLLVIEAAMPSGTIAAVLAARYGCDGAVASSLVVATYLLSLIALPLVILFVL